MKYAVFFLVGLVAIVAALFLARGPANYVPSTEVLLVAAPDSEQPFLWWGRRLDDPWFYDESGRPRHAPEYVAADQRFPDLRSCLLPGAELGGQVDVLRTNWNAIRSGPELEVCVFRIAAALRNPEQTLDWAVRSGFEASLSPLDWATRSALEGKSYPKTTGIAGFNIFANWPRRKFDALTPYPRSLLQDWLERLLLVENTSLSLTISVDENGGPLRVTSGIPYE